jgi:hypothetical protein
MSPLQWVQSTTPDLWTATFTLGLLIVAAVTAYIGLGGLRTANETLRLEAAPYLVVTESLTADWAEKYVITAPNEGRGLVASLRAWDVKKDEPRPEPGSGSVVNPHWGGRLSWPRVTLAVKNVGRSPAISVRVDATFTLSVPDNYKPASAETQKDSRGWAWVAGRGSPLKCDRTGGFGFILFSSIMPGETVYVTIENRYAADVDLSLSKTASIVSADGKKRVTVPVHVPSDHVLIVFR